MMCGHGHEQKFKYPYPRDSKIIQMPYPRAKAIDQNPSLCPASPLRRLDIDRSIKMILASPEVPSTVSLSSWRIMGRQLMKSEVRNGRLPREEVGSNSWRAGSCSLSAKESIRDFSSDCTLGSWWRSFKVGFAVGLSSGVVDWSAPPS